MTPSRSLVLMRHARAEHGGASDAERPLSAAGRADAAAAGRWLASTGFAPDHALVSSALRTRQTWEALAAAAGWELAADHDEGLYAAGPEAALDLVRLVPAETRALLVVGHNPTVAYLAQLLDDGEGDPAVAAESAGGHPPCALTVFGYEGEWADLAPGTATATAFHVGRG